MNNDDMSDEEFDAFLRGEDDLSRRLRGLTQPASSPRLDAAILGYVKSGLAQEARPAAANDAAGGDASPRLAPGLGRRWRIPAGIAAGVLAGVLGHQLYQGGGARKEKEMAAASVVALDQAAAEMAPQAPAAPRPAPVNAEVATAPPPPPVAVAAAPPAHEPPPSGLASPPSVKPAPPAPLPQAPIIAAAPPAPPPVGQALSKPSAPPPAVEGALAGFGSEPKARMHENYTTAPSPTPSRVLAEPETAAAPPAMKMGAAAASERVPVEARRSAEAPSERFSRNEASADRTAGKAAAAPRADQETMHAKRARDWLSVIDTMLKADLKSDALAEWTKFRVAYPDYQVPDEMLARIAAIKR
ncbi:hypothetical protein IV454_25585 [Massilia antarctica]|uniref:Uncharacterized protein n=1 Tax=Massilia antarctica TaxID=2765360 RepID=A0AA49A712_9BURK|nr:hypothetical protein [Massilia antarctica]QPI48844.1 hypothetical protein IV454_25585 [Massilia antarctica]